MPDTLPDALTALREMERGMTPGPWSAKQQTFGVNLVRLGAAQEFVTIHPDADARGLATMRNLFPALLDVVEAAQLVLRDRHAAQEWRMETDARLPWDSLNKLDTALAAFHARVREGAGKEPR